MFSAVFSVAMGRVANQGQQADDFIIGVGQWQSPDLPC